jgi:hypothetical protein
MTATPLRAGTAHLVGSVPLADAETVLYLGLIHHGDGEGDRARIAAARAVVPAFGVASECGWGRTDPARVPGLLDSHRAAALYGNQASPGGGSP